MTGPGGAHSGGMDPEPQDPVPPEEPHEEAVSSLAAREPDTYTTGQAAKLLSRDPSQVRQWVKNERLAALPGGPPYRIIQESVHRLRDQLNKNAASGSTSSNGQAAGGQGIDVEALVRSVVNEVVPRAIEAHTAAADKVEGILRDQIAVERDARLRAESNATEAQAETQRRLDEQAQAHTAELERARAEHEAEAERLRGEAETAREERPARRSWFGGRRGE